MENNPHWYLCFETLDGTQTEQVPVTAAVLSQYRLSHLTKLFPPGLAYTHAVISLEPGRTTKFIRIRLEGLEGP